MDNTLRKSKMSIPGEPYHLSARLSWFIDISVHYQPAPKLFPDRHKPDEKGEQDQLQKQKIRDSLSVAFLVSSSKMGEAVWFIFEKVSALWIILGMELLRYIKVNFPLLFKAP